MGNLADELADAYSDSGEEENDFAQTSSWLPSSPQQPDTYPTDDGNTTTSGSLARKGSEEKRDDLSTPELPKRFHLRKRSGIDHEHGSESDLDLTGVSPSLSLKIDDLGSLTRRGTDSFYGSADDVFRRLKNGLRDLESQATVEGSASRLITAHSALTMHLLHETRQLHGLMMSLLSPLASSPDSRALDSLAPLLVSLCDYMPRPSTLAFNSLTALRTITTELIQTLSYLSDNLQMSRQITATASRRLRSAKELVLEIRRDEELREEGERWISRGNWGERLQKRECAVVCGDVMNGFEDVCNGWRQQLLAQAQSQA